MALEKEMGTYKNKLPELEPMHKFETDALPLEYKLLNPTARRDLDVADVMNKTIFLGKGRVFRPLLEE